MLWFVRQMFDIQGRFLRTFDLRTHSLNLTLGPAMAVDAVGNILIPFNNEDGDHAVSVFDLNGKLLNRIVAPCMERVRGVSVDRAGRVLLCGESVACRVQVFVWTMCSFAT